MKVAVSATQPRLDAVVDPRLGRCNWFVIIDPETLQFETIENPGVNSAGGAGIATAQMLISRNVQAVLTGHCGPNAFQVLSGASVIVVTGVTGQVLKVVNDYKEGHLAARKFPDVTDHFGIGRGPGFSRGQGMHRTARTPDGTSELESLRQESHKMAAELDYLRQRMAEMENKD